ncbi:MAG: DUF4372 domain-containing protein [Verrucomicrobiales bacterium]|nr:DUF4372 domain-containing protein [Verrucomicrobiales bacterium]
MHNNNVTPSGAPARHHYVILGQLLKYIPRSILDAAARECDADARARSFSPLSHLAAMLFAQLAHVLSLNDLCDWLRLKARAIAAWGVTPPSRNNLSHANKVRPAAFIETVFWRTLAHLQRCEPFFGTRRPGSGGKGARRLLHRFKVRIHAVDSTVMELVVRPCRALSSAAAGQLRCPPQTGQDIRTPPSIFPVLIAQRPVLIARRHIWAWTRRPIAGATATSRC